MHKRSMRWGAPAVLVTILAASLLPAGAAQAVDLDGITSVTIVEPTDTITVFENFRLEATWAVPDTAVPGDTFGLTFPSTPLLVGVTDSFILESPDAEEVGSCTVTSTGIECVLGDYVLTHDNVSGSLFFWAQAQETSDSDTLTFTTSGGRSIDVAVPGGEIVDKGAWGPPAEAEKAGVVTTDGDHLEWDVYVPSNQMTAGEVITDTFTPGLTFVPASMQVGYVLIADWNGGAFTDADFVVLAEPVDYVIADDPPTSSFTLTLNGPVPADAIYRLRYQMAVPPGTVAGDVFTNTVSGVGFTAASGSITYIGSGGGGEGDEPGTFSVSKALSGSGTALVPTDTVYSITYSYPAAGGPVTGVIEVVAGQTSPAIGPIPPGTVVTLTEAPPAAVDGVTWGTATYSGTGVSPTAGGAQVTIVTGANVDVAVQNPVELVPPPDPGTFTVSKALSGSGALLVPGDTAYSIAYSYTSPGGTVTGTVSLLAGETSAPIGPVAEGTVVRVEEATPAAIAGVTWGASTYVGSGVTAAGAGATFTIVTATNVNVAVQNTADLVPPPDVPDEPSQGLARTGGEVWGLPLAIALLLGGFVLVRARSVRRASA